MVFKVLSHPECSRFRQLFFWSNFSEIQQILNSLMLVLCRVIPWRGLDDKERCQSSCYPQTPQEVSAVGTSS